VDRVLRVPENGRYKNKRAVIIGAGLGGLTAGSLLAQRGGRVTMFEAHVRPGKYVGGFWRCGSYCESGANGLGGSSTIWPVLKQMGVFDRIGCVRQEHLRFVSPDLDGTAGRLAGLQADGLRGLSGISSVPGPLLCRC